MQIKLNEDLERRLIRAAEERAVSASDLLNEALARYLDALGDDPRTWVRAAQGHLPRVWGEEDFSDWHPPHAAEPR